jgi:amino acid transporter
VAGPAGMILSIIVMGIITVCMSEAVSELTQIFPAPNAIVEWVKAFVDEDLAWVVGAAYWYVVCCWFLVAFESTKM